MTHVSTDLRLATYHAILCAKSAAAAYHHLAQLADFATSGSEAKKEFKEPIQAAYAASAHAWIAIIAMASDNLEVAQQAAQSAQEAEQLIVSFVNTRFLISRETADLKNCSSLPDEKELFRLWNEFCRSLPSAFPVPESFENGGDAFSMAKV
jgi:hypothetical protein